MENVEINMGLKELLNWRLFDLLDGCQVNLNIYVPKINSIRTSPFLFDRQGLVLDRLVSHKDYTSVVRFDPFNPTVMMSHVDEHRGTDIHQYYPIRMFLPTIEGDTIMLDALKEPRFDIEPINELYEMIVNDVDVEVVHILKSMIHPITQLVGDNQVMAMLYELNLEECYELTQAAYIAKFEYALSKGVC